MTIFFNFEFEYTKLKHKIGRINLAGRFSLVTNSLIQRRLFQQHAIKRCKMYIGCYNASQISSLHPNECTE